MPLSYEIDEWSMNYMNNDEYIRISINSSITDDIMCAINTNKYNNIKNIRKENNEYISI